MAGLGQNVGTSFTLRSQMGGSLYAGGQNLEVWFFAPGGMGMGSGFMGDRVLPSAHIEPIEGQQITVSFQNMSPMEHTVHLHGLDVDQQNDGVPATSFAIRPMGSYDYTFVAPHAGTYHYHCHVDTVVHYAKGMYGAVIVRPPNGSTSQAWTGGPVFDEEVIWHLSTMDSSWDAFAGSSTATARYRPDVFLLNGKETAGALSDVYSRVVVPTGQTAYLRLLNAAYHWARVSIGGLNFQVVASDGRPLRSAYSTGVLELGPGERYDILLQPTVAGTKTAQVDYLDDYSGAVLGSVQTQVVAV